MRDTPRRCAPFNYWRNLGILFTTSDFTHPVHFETAASEPQLPLSAPLVIAVLFRLGIDVASNGFRLTFSVLFLSSYIFGPVLQPFVDRVWEGMIRNKTPLFTSIFGAIGAIVTIVYVLLS
jgi:hypothetical protein